jgi:transcriptional repressor NrdR
VNCPFCGHTDSKVIDSRDSGDGVRRRRECADCERRFTTYERVQTRELLVGKQDGRTEGFNRDKLWASLNKACAKRPLPTGSVDKIVEEIETQIVDAGRAEVPARAIGEMVMERLKGLDRVAYIRFASVYRDFQDIDSFEKAVKDLRDDSTQLPLLDDVPIVVKTRRRRGRPSVVRYRTENGNDPADENQSIETPNVPQGDLLA